MSVKLFPSSRRIALVRRNAAACAMCSPNGAETRIGALLRQQRQRFERLGISSDAIDADLAALADAIRREMVRVRLMGVAS